jgi:chromosome segregation ATPase
VSALLSSEFPTISHCPSSRVRNRQRSLQLQINESAAQITEYENIIEGLQQQLTEVQAANVQAHIELNVAAFQLNRAADPLVVLQSTLQQKENEIISANERISELQADRVHLFEFLNNIRAKLLPDFPTFEHSSDSFSSSSLRFLSELSARVLPPWAVNNSSAARLEAQLEELTSANTDYAKETREQRRQIQRLESQNNELRLELHRLRSDRS